MSDKLTEQKIEEMIAELLQEREVKITGKGNAEVEAAVYGKTYNDLSAADQDIAVPGKVLKNLAKLDGDESDISDIDFDRAKERNYYSINNWADQKKAFKGKFAGSSPPPDKKTTKKTKKTPVKKAKKKSTSVKTTLAKKEKFSYTTSSIPDNVKDLILFSFKSLSGATTSTQQGQQAQQKQRKSGFKPIRDYNKGPVGASGSGKWNAGHDDDEVRAPGVAGPAAEPRRQRRGHG